MCLAFITGPGGKGVKRNLRTLNWEVAVLLSRRYRRLVVGIFMSISRSLLIVIVRYSHKCSSASLSATSVSPINRPNRLKAATYDLSLYHQPFFERHNGRYGSSSSR